MAESEHQKEVMDQHDALMDLATSLRAAGGPFPPFGDLAAAYAERLLRAATSSRQRERWAFRQIAKTDAHNDDKPHRGRKVPPQHPDAY